MKFCKRCGHELARCICADPDLFTCVCLLCEREFKSKDGPLEDTCPRCQREQDEAYRASYEAPIGTPARLPATGYEGLRRQIRQHDQALGEQTRAVMRRTVHGPDRGGLRCGDCRGDAVRSVITNSGQSLPLCQPCYDFRSARLLVFADLPAQARRTA